MCVCKSWLILLAATLEVPKLPKVISIALKRIHTELICYIFVYAGRLISSVQQLWRLIVGALFFSDSYRIYILKLEVLALKRAIIYRDPTGRPT